MWLYKDRYLPIDMKKQKTFISSPFNGNDCVVHLGLVMGRVNLAEDRFQNHLQKWMMNLADPCTNTYLGTQLLIGSTRTLPIRPPTFFYTEIFMIKFILGLFSSSMHINQLHLSSQKSSVESNTFFRGNKIISWSLSASCRKNSILRIIIFTESVSYWQKIIVNQIKNV